MIGAVIFSCSFAAVRKLVADVEIAGEDECGTSMPPSQLQASAEKRSLSVELWKITGQERRMPEACEHHATRGLGRRASRSRLQMDPTKQGNSIGGASVGQTGMAHTTVFSPICKGAPTHIVAPFGQQQSVWIQLIEVPAQAGSAGSTAASDVLGRQCISRHRLSALAVMGLEPDRRGRLSR